MEINISNTRETLYIPSNYRNKNRFKINFTD